MFLPFFKGELDEAVELMVSPEATLFALFYSSLIVLVPTYLCGEGKYDLLIFKDDGICCLLFPAKYALAF